MHDHAMTRIAQLLADLTRHEFGVAALVRDVNVARGNGLVSAGGTYEFDHALGTDGKARGRSSAAAQHFNERIVAAAAANRALTAELVRYPFKNRVVVVVKATHQTRINRVVDAKRLHAGFEAAQETAGVFAQEVEQTRGGFHHRLHVGVFGVQNAQRIGFQTATGVFVEHVVVVLQIGN